MNKVALRPFRVIQILSFTVFPIMALMYWNTMYAAIAAAFAWTITSIADATYHRCWAHKMYEPKNTFTKRVMLFLGSYTTWGSVIEWGLLHRVHHKWPDTELDPHSVKLHGAFDVWTLNWWNVEHMQEKKYVKMIVDLLRDKDLVWQNKWHNYTVLVWPLLLGSIAFYYQSVEFFVWTYAFPQFLANFFSGMLNVLGHTHPHWKWVGFICAGHGHHDQHHLNQTKHKYDEWDFTYYWTRLFGKNFKTELV